MSEALTIMFTCPKCSLMTPGIARLPTGVNPKRPIDLSNDCHHCGESMTKSFASVEQLRREAEAA